MNTTEIKERTYELLGWRFFTYFDSKMYVDWAVSLMEVGVESENLSILAGLDYSDTEERERYFKKTLEDLNIEIPVRDTSLAEKFMVNLSKMVLDGKIAPQLALQHARDISIITEYKIGGWVQFIYLDEDLDYLKHDGHTLFSNNMKKGCDDEYIKKEFEIWLESHNLGLQNITDLMYCTDCGAVMPPVIKKGYKPSLLYNCCGRCKSRNVLSGYGQDVRIKIVSVLKQ